MSHWCTAHKAERHIQKGKRDRYADASLCRSEDSNCLAAPDCAKWQTKR